jgi:pentatricopeptide repeat protein
VSSLTALTTLGCTALRMQAAGLQPDEKTWTTLLDGYLGCGQWTRVRKTVQEMHAAEMQPASAINSALIAYVQSGKTQVRANPSRVG